MPLRDSAIDLAKRLLPPSARDGVVRLQRRLGLQWPRRGSVDFGSFHRLHPISPIFGIDRGQPIDRYYIDRFLEANADRIRGRCLELGDPSYIQRFGTGVTQTDVLHVVAGNPAATIVGDLTDAPHIPSDAFDCIIFTQSLQMIVDMRAALRTLHRILKPGGTLLLTTHGISKIGRRLGRDDWGEYWHLTAQGVDVLFQETFPGSDVEIRPYGNVLAAISSLHGLAAEELLRSELDHSDPDFEVLIGVRATKGAASGA